MATKNAGSVPKFHLTKGPTPPKLTEPVIKGPGVPKLKAAPTQKSVTLPSLTVQARRGLTPKVVLAKAAAGSSANTSKRNSYYPTP